MNKSFRPPQPGIKILGLLGPFPLPNCDNPLRTNDLCWHSGLTEQHHGTAATARFGNAALPDGRTAHALALISAVKVLGPPPRPSPSRCSASAPARRLFVCCPSDASRAKAVSVKLERKPMVAVLIVHSIRVTASAEFRPPTLRHLLC